MRDPVPLPDPAPEPIPPPRTARPDVVLAVDIGGTKAAVRARRTGAGVVGGSVDSGVVRVEWAPDAAPDDDLGQLAAAADRALRTVGAARPRTTVVALPATLDAHGRISRWPGRPSWRGRPLPAQLAHHWGDSLAVHDDALLAGYAEALARPRTEGLLYLGLGTGVGGAWLPPRNAGAPVPRLDELMPCEAGHLVVRPDDGRPCDCGRRGCLQAYASGPALHRATTADGRTAALAAAADACALAVAGIGELLPFAAVVLGGGLGAAPVGLAAALTARLRHRIRHGSTLPEVTPAVHGAGASLQGALLLAESRAATGRDRHRPTAGPVRREAGPRPTEGDPIP
ncbi:ROK family protein [Streptomyces sp. NPDC051018]|uniref:ROK family protein n=1 Tax=Streptomyces sp. NPDC051018 TaxID=3365639 RepID=UPI0037BE1335